jgi:hypothetical protein
MTEFVPDDLFPELDPGVGDLSQDEPPMDVPPGATGSEIAVGTEVTVIEFLFEESHVGVSGVGEPVTELVLPDPFTPEGGVGAAAAIGGWLARRFTRGPSGGETLAVQFPRSDAAYAQELETALRAEPGVSGTSSATAASGGDTIEVVVELVGATTTIVQRLVGLMRTKSTKDAVLVLPGGAHIPLAQVEDQELQRLLAAARSEPKPRQ